MLDKEQQEDLDKLFDKLDETEKETYILLSGMLLLVDRVIEQLDGIEMKEYICLETIQTYLSIITYNYGNKFYLLADIKDIFNELNSPEEVGSICIH